MSMSPARRKTYLDALGVEPWTLRVGDDERRAERSAPSSFPLASDPAPEQRFSAATTTPVRFGTALTAAVPVRETAAAAPMPTPIPKTIVPYDAPKTWEELQPAVTGCTRCKLCKTRTNTVFGVGDCKTNLLVVGEGPGADEDAQGEPFVGRAGKLLDEMLRAIGRSRREPAAEKSVYIANVVKCRPPGNRDPEAEEVEACRPYLDRQIELIKPKLIVALGRIAGQRLLATDLPLSKLRGQMHEYGESRTPVLITYHPAYLLRSPGEKAKSWADLKRVHQFLQSAG